MKTLEKGTAEYESGHTDNLTALVASLMSVANARFRVSLPSERKEMIRRYENENSGIAHVVRRGKYNQATHKRKRDARALGSPRGTADACYPRVTLACLRSYEGINDLISE